MTTKDDTGPPTLERRKQLRRRLLIGVRVVSDQGKPLILGELVDLSPKGARMVLLGPFELGARVRVTLDQSLSKRSIRFDGTVVWREQIETGFAHGLELKDLSPEVEKPIRELMDSTE